MVPGDMGTCGYVYQEQKVQWNKLLVRHVTAQEERWVEKPLSKNLVREIW